MEEQSSVNFNIALWESRFSVEEVAKRAHEWTGWKPVSSPCHVVGIEAARREALQDVAAPQGVPADIFVFGCGSAPRRDLTQVGGLPYRPSGLPWPADQEGQALTFMGQMRFAESKDLFADLPGDILLLFADIFLIGHLHTEWYPLGLDNLIRADEIPETDWQISPFYGERYRTVDFKDFEGALSAASPFWIGVKIGGLSSFEFDKLGVYRGAARPEAFFSEYRFIEEPTGLFLGSFSSVQPEPDIRWPWVNVEHPIPLQEHSSAPQFMIGDMRRVELFLQDNGAVFWQLAPCGIWVHFEQ